MNDTDHNAVAAHGTIVLRGVAVTLDGDVGAVFIADCARNIEGLLSDLEIKTKYELNDDDWERLAANPPLLDAVRAERDHRIRNGEAAREAAQLHFSKAPAVLNEILTDEQVAPRHRIEAAKELRQAAAGSGSEEPGSKEKFTITINLGADCTLHHEFEMAPRQPPEPEGGE